MSTHQYRVLSTYKNHMNDYPPDGCSSLLLVFVSFPGHRTCPPVTAMHELEVYATLIH